MNIPSGYVKCIFRMGFFQVAYYLDLDYNYGKKGLGGSIIEYRNKKRSKYSWR